MITIADMKNFFQEYWGYLLLGVSGFSLLGVGTYYVFFNEQPEPVVVDHNQNETLKGKNQTKKQKTKKNILDPVIDNIYWSIASFAVYYSVYLGLRYSGYKDQAFWLIPTLIVLGKLGLITFSSFYYQKNSFLQNLNKSINPAYFIHQDIYQIVLSLVGCLGLAALIYFDRKKPEQLPGGQFPGGQQPEEVPAGQLGGIPLIFQQKEGHKINERNQGNSHNQNNKNLSEEEKEKIKEENKKKNDQWQRQKAWEIFQEKINIFSTQEPFVGVINSLKNKGIKTFEEIIEPIKKNILDGKISINGVLNLINYSSVNDIMFSPHNGEDYYLEKYRPEKQILNCFLFCLKFFFDEKDYWELSSIFLARLAEKDLDDQKILSLQKTINEFFYFANCMKNIRRYIRKKEKKFAMNNIIKFKTDSDINKYHLIFLRFMIGISDLREVFKQKNNSLDIDDCVDVKIFHKFFVDRYKEVEQNKN